MKLLNTNTRFWSPFLWLFIISSFTITAQEHNRIQLLNQSNNSPIASVSFTYDQQLGLSNQQGFIEIEYQEGVKLTLSHVSYGEVTLSDEQVKEAISQGSFFLIEKMQSLYPVTVIALRTKTQEINILELDYMDKMDHDAGAILNRTPAIGSIKKSGSYGFDPVLRGFKYDQLNIVIDGAMTATTACPNRMDPPTSQVAPNMIDRVDILKGPHALRFGGGVGGTVNFISTPHHFSNKNNVYGRVSGGYESNGNMIRSEGLIGFNGKRYDIGIFGAYSKADDYIDGNGNTVSSRFTRGSLGANLGFLLSDNQQISFSATRNIARDAMFPALPMDLRKDDTWLLNAKHNITFKDKQLQSWNTTIYGSLVNHLMDNLLKDLNPRPMNAATNATTYTYGGRTEGNWKFKRANLYAGADLRIEGAEGTRTREILVGPSAGKIFYDNVWQNSRINRAGAFGEYHLGMDALHLVLSGRVEYNKSEMFDPDESFTRFYETTGTVQINPSFSVGLIKNLEHNITLGLWLARAQRSGSLTERYINFFPVGQGPYLMVGNPELNPEVNNEIDITFEIKSEKTIINFDVFASYGQDYISSSIDTILYMTSRFVNLGEVFRTGFEFNWNQMLFAGMGHNLGFAYTYGQDLERDAPLAEIAPLDFRYTLYGSYLKNKLKPEVTFRYVIEQERISTAFGETVTPSFAILDFTVAYNFNKMLSVSGGVKNLFDQAYYEHLSRSVRGPGDLPIYDPGRSVFVSLNLKFL